MDVTCERCGTEYEFDETLLSGRGTSVKCTNCGHVFKVYPKAAADADRTTSSWRLKTASGLIDTIDSLRELQRRIASGELTPDDEIARGDEGWKSLGSIPELETFFRAAGVAIASQRIPSPIPPVAPRETAESSLPPGRRPRQPTLLGVSPIQRAPGPAPEPAAGVPEAREETPREPEAFVETEAMVESTSFEPDEPAPPPEVEEPRVEATEPASAIDSDALPDLGATRPESSYQSPYTRDSLPGAPADEVEDAVFQEQPAEQPTSSVRTSTQPPAYYDDDDIPELPARGTSPLRWLLVIVAVGALALIASQWDRVARLVGIGADPALIAAGIAEGDAAVAEAHPVAYEAAIAAYQRAAEAGGDEYLEVLTKLSNATALSAQARLDDGEARESAATLVAQALAHAEAGAAIDSRALETRLTMVDALRLSGSTEDARERLEEARAMSFSRTAEFYRVDARLSAAEAEGRLENGLRSARQAAELAPEEVRYQLLMARAERASGNAERAKEVLGTILEDHPEHPVATALLASVASERHEEPTAEADAGVPVEEEAEAPAPPGPEAAAGAPTEKTEPPKAAPPPPAPKPAKTEPARKPAPTAKRTKPRPTRTKPKYDEYDRLAQAAGSDAFIDGRPPVLDYESNMKKGREELRAGNYARARAYFDSALEVHPGSADAMDALGDVATAVSDYASALRYYRVAAQRGHPAGYYKLGQTYEKLGKKDEAVSAYYTYVTRRPDGAHAADARRAIHALEPRAKLPESAEPPTPQTKATAQTEEEPEVVPETGEEPPPELPADTPSPESP